MNYDAASEMKLRDWSAFNRRRNRRRAANLTIAFRNRGRYAASVCNSEVSDTCLINRDKFLRERWGFEQQHKRRQGQIFVSLDVM